MPMLPLIEIKNYSPQVLVEMFKNIEYLNTVKISIKNKEI